MVQAQESKIWTAQKANEWYAKQPWLAGANFLPSTAINQLEMWQAETFDTATINRELGWAQTLGMNTMRVFLHNLAWQQDPKGFKKRIDHFLFIAHRHHIKPLFVFLMIAGMMHPKSVSSPSPNKASTIQAGCRVRAN